MASPSVVRVQLGTKPSTVQSITYGSRTLKSATDLSLVGGQNGDMIIYHASNGNFTLSNTAPSVANLDAGFF